MSMFTEDDIAGLKALTKLAPQAREEVFFILGDGLADEVGQLVENCRKRQRGGAKSYEIGELIDNFYETWIIAGVEEGLGPALSGTEASYRDVSAELRDCFSAMVKRQMASR